MLPLYMLRALPALVHDTLYTLMNRFLFVAIDKSDDDQTSSGKKSLQFYNSSTVFTKDGNLVIETNTQDTKWKGWNPYKKKYETMVRHFKSGMLQSWNKFCYTGGILELDVTFPGRHDVGKIPLSRIKEIYVSRNAHSFSVYLWELCFHSFFV